jgi:hypothetical protein
MQFIHLAANGKIVVKNKIVPVGKVYYTGMQIKRDKAVINAYP